MAKQTAAERAVEQAAAEEAREKRELHRKDLLAAYRRSQNAAASTLRSVAAVGGDVQRAEAAVAAFQAAVAAVGALTRDDLHRFANTQTRTSQLEAPLPPGTLLPAMLRASATRAQDVLASLRAKHAELEARLTSAQASVKQTEAALEALDEDAA